MDNTIKTFPISEIITAFANVGEVTINDLCCAKIKAYLKDYPDYRIFVRQGRSAPDGIITYKGRTVSLLEFKRDDDLDTIKGALCQMFCYSAKSPKSIIPYKKFVVITFNRVYIFDKEEMELVYDNFLLYYDTKDTRPSDYWSKRAPVEIRRLFANIEKLWEDTILLKDLNFEEFTNKLIN